MTILIELNSPEYKKSLAAGLAYNPIVRITEEFGKYTIHSESNFMDDHIVKCFVDGLGRKAAACSCTAGQFGKFCQHIGPVVEYHKPIAKAKLAYDILLANQAIARIKAGAPALLARVCTYAGCPVKLAEGREHFCFLHELKQIGSRIGEKFSPKSPCLCHKC